MRTLLQKIRVDQNITIRELAKATGLSPSDISYIETGRREATKGQIESFAKALGKTVEEIYTAWKYARMEEMTRPKHEPVLAIVCGPQGCQLKMMKF